MPFAASRLMRLITPVLLAAVSILAAAPGQYRNGVVRLLPPLVMKREEAALLTEKLAELIRMFLG